MLYCGCGGISVSINEKASRWTARCLFCRRIGTLNCGHAAFPIILGVNRPQYTPEELEKFRTDNEKGVTVDGKHYTGYEAAQMQRKLEAAIRAQQRRITADEAAGDGEKLARDKVRLAVLRQRYVELSKKAGLRTQYERTEGAGFGKQQFVVMENGLNRVDHSDILQIRGMAMGLRRPVSRILAEDEIASIKADAEAIGIDPAILRFNAGGQTGFSDSTGFINIRGDILPDLESSIARDRMSQRAVLAHEYYGHYLHHPSEYAVGDWRDEFRASYSAAVDAPNLSDEERRLLMLDAYDRAKEAGAFSGYDEMARRIIYGI